MLGDDVVISLDGVFVPGSIEEGDDVPAKDGALVGETTGSVVGTGVFPLCPNGASVAWPVAS